MTERKVIMTDPKRNDYLYEEAIKTLRTNIQFIGTAVKSIVVTSCYPNEGKSDVVFQLALEIGKMGKKVLILDADIRKSSYIGRFQVKQKTEGLSQYLSGQSRIQDIVYNTNFQGVDIIFAGPSAPNPSELLAQENFAALVHDMREKYDYVLADTPPIGNLTDAAIIARQCDGAILVIESDLVSRRVAAKAKEKLERGDCHILGAVLNKIDMKKSRYYSKYNYYYGNEKSKA